MAKAVLDSSALLAAIDEESGAEVLAAVILDAMISAVNLAEVVTKLVARGATRDDYQAAIAAFDLETVDFSRQMAEATGELVARTHPRGLSLGDRACIALGVSVGLPVYTADKNWSGQDLGCEIRQIR